MKLKTLLLSLALGGLAGCGGLGDGSTVETLKLVPASTFYEQSVLLNKDTATERLRVYDCMCSNLVALATFSDGTVANFGARVTYTSSDPAVVRVLALGETDSHCPLAQQAAGLLVPLALTGGTPVTITAEYAGLRDTLEVEVTDTSAATAVDLHPLAPATGQMAVGTDTVMQFTAMLDGYKRFFNNNVTSWDIVEDTDAATISTTGVVHGIAASASALTVKAAFAACSDVTASSPVQVGDIAPPLLIAREPGFVTDGADQFLAVNTSELLQVTAPLDFDGDGIANPGDQQVISPSVKLSFSGSCTLRTYDVAQPNGCLDTPASTCDQTTPVCSATATTCAATHTACRVTATPVNQGFGARNQVRADNDDGTATNFSATFPFSLGTATTLSADVADAAATTISVTALTGYPTTFPWYGVIDQAGAREDVRVTAVTGTTLTVVRGTGGTTAQAHVSGASFNQRSYATTAPLPLTGKKSTLTSLDITDPVTPLDSQGTLQLDAFGVFTDDASATRQQRVTRLLSSVTDAATVTWTTSDSAIANVDAGSGLVLATDKCGGRVSIRARSSTSTDATTETFDPDSTADDTACGTDALCDQVDLCIATPSPVPDGLSCPTVTTCP